MPHGCCICSSIDEHLGCFHILAIGNSAAINIGVHVFFWISALGCSLDIYPEMKPLGAACLFFTKWIITKYTHKYEWWVEGPNIITNSLYIPHVITWPYLLIPAHRKITVPFCTWVCWVFTSGLQYIHCVLPFFIFMFIVCAITVLPTFPPFP